MIPDITFQLAKERKPMALFSPYDVERVMGMPFADVDITAHYDEMLADERIRRTMIDARALFTTIAEVQFESGYPYLLFADNANRANPIDGRITMSNLCSEILQVQEPSTEQRHRLAFLGQLERDVGDHHAQRERFDADLLVGVLAFGVEELEGDRARALPARHTHVPQLGQSAARRGRQLLPRAHRRQYGVDRARHQRGAAVEQTRRRRGTARRRMSAARTTGRT